MNTHAKKEHPIRGAPFGIGDPNLESAPATDGRQPILAQTEYDCID